ncbi:hypothetical protein GCM10011351_09380 [Paraliobacillus quinghaiensis]|uniref:YhcN/YlaJ family sporulation lipoprotein n=1 Tax=Paraliobacillus quinghaiensis TaxID=470815 RepID=A0A917TJZ5_9BACI|nr:YhcN/YlaJ family sporulation lipoprotein [Paraliobacillus quinghaiensis]GGM25836.1 hypothetical protein GCM10011351_09380 [Paraliobacillus quinghaiensis]
MEWKKVSIALLTASTLVACGAQDNNEVGQQGMNNIDPVRNDTTLDTPLRNQNVGNGQDDQLTNNRGNTTYDGNYQIGYDPTAENNGAQNNVIQRDNMNNMNNNGKRANNGYHVADRAADRVNDEVQGVDNVYVVTKGNNAYVAADLNRRGNTNGTNNDDGLTDRIKRQIAKVVKAETQNVDYVYVSTNPDFMNLTTDYADNVENGEPIEGFFDQFGEMIERVFPQQAD